MFRPPDKRRLAVIDETTMHSNPFSVDNNCKWIGFNNKYDDYFFFLQMLCRVVGYWSMRFVDFCEGDNLQQEQCVHAADNGYDRVAPVPGHAATQHLQRSRLHHGLLDHIPTVSGGTQTHLGYHSRNQSTFNLITLIIAFFFIPFDFDWIWIDLIWYNNDSLWLNEGIIRQRASDVGGQQMRRDRSPWAQREGRRRPGQTLGLSLHGNLGQNQSQRQRTLPSKLSLPSSSVFLRSTSCRSLVQYVCPLSAVIAELDLFRFKPDFVRV